MSRFSPTQFLWTRIRAAPSAGEHTELSAHIAPHFKFWLVIVVPASHCLKVVLEIIVVVEIVASRCKCRHLKCGQERILIVIKICFFGLQNWTESRLGKNLFPIMVWSYLGIWERSARVEYKIPQREKTKCSWKPRKFRSPRIHHQPNWNLKSI